MNKIESSIFSLKVIVFVKLRNLKFQNKGFSLIELLLVITIIGIISSTSYVGFLQFSRKQALDIAVDNLKNDLNIIKSSATSQVRVTPECTPANLTLIGHQVVFNSTSYVLQEVCSDGGADILGTIKTVSLQAVGANSSPNPVRFLVLNRGLSGGAQATVTLTHTNTSKTQQIIIDPVGIIK